MAGRSVRRWFRKEWQAAMNLTILDTGLARKDPYVIIDENEKVLAASYEENGEHSKSGLLRLTD
jgi:hypothetical protein